MKNEKKWDGEHFIEDCMRNFLFVCWFFFFLIFFTRTRWQTHAGINVFIVTHSKYILVFSKTYSKKSEVRMAASVLKQNPNSWKIKKNAYLIRQSIKTETPQGRLSEKKFKHSPTDSFYLNVNSQWKLSEKKLKHRPLWSSLPEREFLMEFNLEVNFHWEFPYKGPRYKGFN